MPFWEAVAVPGTGKWPPGASPRRRAVAAARKPIARVRCTADRESLYSVLGLAAGASDKEIKQAYRRLALKLHPDVNKAPGAEESFIRVKQAYQILINASTRKAYDSSKRPRRRGKEEEEFYGLDDFVRDLQAEWDKRRSSTKSLWEELGEIGEEFLEFLEKELGAAGRGPEAAQQSSSADEKSQAESKAESESKLEAEIEEMLSRLKDELGM